MPLTRENGISRDASLAYDSVRKIAEMWGISRGQFEADWLSHVSGEKTGLEREPAFSIRKETRG